MKKLVLQIALIMGLGCNLAFAGQVNFEQDYITFSRADLLFIEVYDKDTKGINALKIVTYGTYSLTDKADFVALKNTQAIPVDDKFIVTADKVHIAREIINGATFPGIFSKTISLSSNSYYIDAIMQIKDEIKATGLLPIYRGNDGVQRNIGAWYSPLWAKYWYFRK